MATKRKHHEVTLKVKCEALKELEKGSPNEDVVNQLSISGSTLATWKKAKKKSLKLFKIHHLQIPCTILFKGEEKYIEVLKKQLILYPL